MAKPRKTDFSSYEPELDDVLDDPVVRAVMDRDGVGRDDILDLAASARERWGSEDDDEGSDSDDAPGYERDDEWE